MPELTVILIHHADCSAKEVGEGLVITYPQESTTHSLDELGAFIWRQIDGKRTLADILTAILAEYSVAEDKACTDLVAFADELLQAGLVQAV
jgi:coenzyme PQQ synthesis protein D (PqqD)